MSLRCPHCSSIIDALDAASSSIICPGCGAEVSGTSVNGRREDTRQGAPHIPEATLDYPRKVVVKPRKTGELPSSLGRYRLLEELGAGAFGRVYRGFDSELQRPVAIKILKAERFANQAELEGFFDEARLMASVHHPGIVAVHDVGIDHGLNYIVTQLIGGGTLHDRLTRGPLTHAEAADLIRQCASAIHAAHKVQLYHRDLKPKNILLDQQGRAYVGDFGLAIRRRDQANRVGEFAGSVNFMSPEQLRGEVDCIDGRTDVWALGVIFYLMLTGQLPFQGSTTRLITEIQNRHPLPPRQLNETIPPELERICLKCLKKPLESRYPTAFDLADDLGKWLATNEAGLRGPVVLEPSVPNSTADGLQAPTVLMPRPAKARSKTRMYVIAGLTLLVGLGWFGRHALTMLTIANPSAATQGGSRSRENVAEKPKNPFQIDSYSITGRPYPLLEVSPPELIWPRSDAGSSAHFDFVEARQELLVEAPVECLVGLGQTKSESFRIRLSIKQYGRDGFAGVFWGHQDVPAELSVSEQQCHAVLVQTITKGDGSTYLEMHRCRMVFRDKPHSSAARFEPSMLGSVEVKVNDLGPHDLDIAVHAGILDSVKWCGNQLMSLRDVEIASRRTAHPSRGVFGVAVMSTSARFSDARVTFFEKALPVNQQPEVTK